MDFLDISSSSVFSFDFVDDFLDISSSGDFAVFPLSLLADGGGSIYVVLEVDWEELLCISCSPHDVDFLGDSRSSYFEASTSSVTTLTFFPKNGGLT